MALEYDHEEIVKALALKIEKDSRFGLVKFFTSWSDVKTDLIGVYYPDITCLRRQGKAKLMIEVETPYSFEDPDEVARLENLSEFCTANQWEYYIACPDQKTLDLLRRKIDGRTVRPKDIWLIPAAPFVEDKPPALLT